jgi:hypothetical protein
MRRRRGSPLRVRVDIVDAQGEPAIAFRQLRRPDDIREDEALVALLRRDRIDALVPVWRRDPGNAGLARSVRRQFVAAGGKVSNGVPDATETRTFNGVVSSVSAQAAALRSGGATHVGVYPAGFDEVVDSFALPAPTRRSRERRGTEATASRLRLAWSTTRPRPRSRTQSATRTRPSDYRMRLSDAPARCSRGRGGSSGATPTRLR